MSRDWHASEMISVDSGRRRAITSAAWLSIVYGIVSTPGVLLTIISLTYRGSPPVVFGVRWAGGGPFEEMGLDGWRLGLGVGLVANLVDILIGVLLRGRRRSGGFITLVKFPVDIGLAVGYGAALVPMVVYPIRLALVSYGWPILRTENPDARASSHSQTRRERGETM